MHKILHLSMLVLYQFLLPFRILAFIPIYVVRIVVKLLALMFKPDLVSMLTPVDGMFSADQIYTCPRNTIVGCLVLEGTVDSSLVRDMLDRNILKARCEGAPGKWMYPELRRTVKHWLGYAFWVECELLHGGISTYEKELSPEELHKFQAELTFKPYRKNAPLWELVIIKGITDKPNSSAVFFRFHHALADGHAVLSLLRKMTSLPNPTICRKVIKPTQQRCTGFEALRLLAAPYDIIKEKKESGKNSWLIKDKMDWTQPDYNVHYSALAARLRFNYSEAIAFSIIRQVGAAHGVSGTAVMHSAMLGAVRKSYFPNDAESISSVTVQTPLVPPWGKGVRLLGNNVTFGSYSANMGELDVVKRLIKTHEGLVAMKRSASPAARSLYILALGCMPRFAIRSFFKGKDQEEKIFVFNLPAGEEVDNFCGYRIKHMEMTVGTYAGNSGLGISFITAGGNLRIGVLGDQNVLLKDRAKEIIINFTEELEALKNATPLQKEIYCGV